MAKDKFKKGVKKWKEDVRKERVKRETISVIREKKKAKPIARTGKCPPGKVLRGNKCMTNKEFVVGTLKKHGFVYEKKKKRKIEP